jgi:acetate kinase
MNAVKKSILTINGGSSSIKFALFTASRSLPLTLKGQIARIGLPDTTFSVQGADQIEYFARPVAAKDHTAGVALLMDWIKEQDIAGSLVAVGHRIVHGGPNFHEPQRLTLELVEALRRLTALDPEHLPEEIALAEAFHRRFPHLPQVACFDTAFHHDLPRVARLLPIPRRYEAEGVRRYGFHGLSYEFLMAELVRIEGSAAGRGRIVLAHLGNGASLAAVRHGMPIDTSMGFTPASGVPMGTRSGDLDPGLVGYLARSEGLDAMQFNEMVNTRSGMLGVSETSADMRDLLECEAKDPRAAEAVALFCYQIRKCIGAYAAALGGLDTLVFAGGIGEKSPVVRQRICADLGFLGIELEGPRNEANADQISTDAGRVKVRVMRTNEEQVIARSVCRVLGIVTEKQKSK